MKKYCVEFVIEGYVEKEVFDTYELAKDYFDRIYLDLYRDLTSIDLYEM